MGLIEKSLLTSISFYTLFVLINTETFSWRTCYILITLGIFLQSIIEKSKSIEDLKSIFFKVINDITSQFTSASLSRSLIESLRLLLFCYTPVIMTNSPIWLFHMNLEAIATMVILSDLPKLIKDLGSSKTIGIVLLILGVLVSLLQTNLVSLFLLILVGLEMTSKYLKSNQER